MIAADREDYTAVFDLQTDSVAAALEEVRS